MTEDDLNALRGLIREEVPPLIRAEVGPIRAEVGAIGADLGSLRTRIDKIGAAVEAMRPNVEGIPLLQRAISTIHQEQRMMKAAINEIARTQFTSGEVEALHSDVNSVQSAQMEVETRLLALERQMREVLEKLNGR
jgi:hypothetical protein